MNILRGIPLGASSFAGEFGAHPAIAPGLETDALGLGPAQERFVAVGEGVLSTAPGRVSPF